MKNTIVLSTSDTARTLHSILSEKFTEKLCGICLDAMSRAQDTFGMIILNGQVVDSFIDSLKKENLSVDDYELCLRYTVNAWFSICSTEQIEADKAELN